MDESRLYKLIIANECRNTHHKLAMNALRHLRCANATAWSNLFVHYFEHYLQGSKDPDKKFRDFRNHVLHVGDNYWGGAETLADHWYTETVTCLSRQRWHQAVYAAGVLSHYYMDPLMPLHTGQTEEEGVIHRACEWSVNKAFKDLIERLTRGPGYPDVTLPTGNAWIQQAVRQGAEHAHGFYQDFLDHYDLQAGTRNPPDGLDGHLQDIVSGLLGYASVGFARILDRAIEESGAAPPHRGSRSLTLLYLLTTPLSWIAKSWSSARERRGVKAVLREFEKRGKVIDALGADEQLVRTAHAEEVLKIDLATLDAQPIAAVGTKHAGGPARTAIQPSAPRRRRARARHRAQEANGEPASAPIRVVDNDADSDGDRRTRNKTAPVFRLDADAPLADAPSIGPKTAKRFRSVSITTVGEFLAADPADLAGRLKTDHITEKTVRLWQTQARLACQIPRIYGHDAQILAWCGFETPEEIAATDPQSMLTLIEEFSQSQEARFILRDSKPPDLAEISDWIEWSRQSRPLAAA